MQDESRYLTALLSICTEINQSPSLREIFNLLLDQMIWQLHVDAAAVLSYDPQVDKLQYAAARGFRADDVSLSSLCIDAEQFRRAALESQIIHIPNLREDETVSERTELVETEAFISYYGIPLVAKEQLLGVLEVFHRAPLTLESEAMIFLKVLAAEAALATTHALLQHELQLSNLDRDIAYEATLSGWVRALDVRDREMEGHSLRVTELTIRLARKMGVSDEQLMHISRGALLHDVGKLGISDAILHKPGKLTEEELRVLKQHPTLGYQLLLPIKFLQPALDIVYCHHERWDGTGYPRGLKGEEIPLAARIFAVVDVWDALVSERMFRRSTPKDQAIAYVKDQAGKTLDPEVVATFLSLFEE